MTGEADDLTESRRGMRDLAALIALPAMWVDHDPADIAKGLLGVLFSVLALDAAYVRIEESTRGGSIEYWRPHGSQPPSSFTLALASGRNRERGARTTITTLSSDDDAVRVTSMPVSLPGVEGHILVGSRRNSFPTEQELYLLRVAVGQAAISIRTSRHLVAERAARIAAEDARRRSNALLSTLVLALESTRAALDGQLADARAFINAESGQAEQKIDSGDMTQHPAPIPSMMIAAPASGLPNHLTRREAEVLGLLAQGLSNKEIAGVLWLSDRTVERHITSIYRKIEVDRRSEATIFAIRHGLIDERES